ncbi:MAG: hypothetical protein BGO40_04885 [Chryseobacterium sp. 39-10]|nr:MAG: hypothetical protein BGO40_04885 [Chryseobacterium sp. 39-10]
MENPNPISLYEPPKIGIQNSNDRILTNQNFSKPIDDKLRKQNEALIQETQREINAQIKQQNQKKILEQLGNDYTKIYSLNSFADNAQTKAYYSAFENLSKLNPENYSIADATFLVENAFYNNDKNFQNTFQNYIQKATKIIRSEITKKKIDDDDSPSKNVEIFKYFSQDTKQNGQVVHKAMKYDFDDYFGTKDYSKMFVSKLMKTNSGQCHSMPLLYLILAEQLGAKANLVMSPNHSYIRFEDSDGEMQSIELTNGMFSTDTFVLNSGYIKSEGLQSGIYMKNLSEKELLSQTFVDLASGYIHKFGYDEFVAKVLEKALELNPNNVNASAWKSNTDQTRFLQATKRLGLNPQNTEDFENIKKNPHLVGQMLEIKHGHEKIEKAGYSTMTSEEYSTWLGSLQKGENKQKNKEIAERLRALELQRQKEAKKNPVPKTIQPKKEAPKTYTIPKEYL